MSKITMVFFMFISVMSLAQPGSFDTTFGTNGKVATNFLGGSNTLNSIALQNDGKIIASGEYDFGTNGTNCFLTVRYNADGSIDTTFNSIWEGVIFTTFGARSGAHTNAVQQDGKILVAGFTADSATNQADFDIMVVRYNSNGSLDTTFNGTGIVTIDTSNHGIVRNIQLQPDGKIILAGSFEGLGNIMRLMPDGSIDTTFNGAGYTGSIQTNVYTHLKLLENGKILFGTGFTLFRYNNDGTPDTTFGTSGKTTAVLTGASMRAFDVAANGDIFVIGQRYVNNAYTNFLSKFKANGTLDSTFGSSGLIVDSPVTGLSHGTSIAILENTVYGGYSVGPATNYDNKVIAYTPGGAIDTTFGSGGSITFSISSSNAHDYLNTLIFQPDGKLIAGIRNMSGGSGFSMARIHTAASLSINEMPLSKTSIYVYPNPLTDTSVLKLDMPAHEILSVKLYNLSGQLIYTICKNSAVEEGQILLPLQHQNLASGVYILEADTGRHKDYLRILK